jgi:hypothetical protein
MKHAREAMSPRKSRFPKTTGRPRMAGENESPVCPMKGRMVRSP